MIKCMYCIVLVLCLNFPAQSQMISNELIASTGDYFSNSTGILEGSLGMIATATWTSTEGMVFEGFYHPQVQISTVSRKNFKVGPKMSIKTFPNPVFSHVTIQVRDAGEYEVDLMDVSGRVLKTVPFRQQTEINMQGFPNGSYFLKVRGQDWINESIKIIKR